jgi:hypothetical protein
MQLVVLGGVDICACNLISVAMKDLTELALSLIHLQPELLPDVN